MNAHRIFTIDREIDEPPARRGVIVVDSSALFRLAMPLSPDMLSSKTGEKIQHMRDTLIFLARNGYKIIVPEMIAYENSRLLRDGTVIGDYFFGDHKPFTGEMAAFIRQAVADGDITLGLTSPDDISPAADFMRELNAIHTASIEGLTPHELRDWKRHQIIELQKTDKKDFGELAAWEYIIGMTDTSLPVFFLCNDNIAAQMTSEIWTDVNLYPLTVFDCVDALKKEGVLSHLGIHNTISARELSNQMNEYSAKITGAKSRHRSYYMDGRTSAAFAETLQGILGEPPAPEPVKLRGPKASLFNSTALRPAAQFYGSSSRPIHDYGSPSAKQGPGFSQGPGA